MRLTEKQLADERETRRLQEAGEWLHTRWWRLGGKDGGLMAESSDEAEIRGFATEEPGSVVQHLFEKHKRRWREA